MCCLQLWKEALCITALFLTLLGGAFKGNANGGELVTTVLTHQPTQSLEFEAKMTASGYITLLATSL